MRTYRYTSFILILLLAGTAPTALAAGKDEEVDKQVQAVISKCMPAFVFIARQKGGSGSGAVISPDGYVITNAHVVGADIKFTVRLGNGKSYSGKVVGRDKVGDLALIKLDNAKDLPYIKLGNSDDLRVGDPCIAIGNPIALGAIDQNASVTMGVVSGLHQFRGGGRYNDAVVTDAPINPGNSGGPLLNLDGELIGVNGLVETRIGLRSNTGLGYAIPSNQVNAWLPVLKDTKRLDVHHCRLLGLKFETDFDKLSEAGALIKEVEKESDADKFGFKAGDLIYFCQGNLVWNATRFAGIVGVYPAGTEISVRLIREGETVILKFKPDERRPARFGFVLNKPARGDMFLRIGKVDPKSASAKAGLKSGDELIGIGKQRLGGLAQVQYAILVQRWLPSVIAGSRIALTVRRREDGKIVEKEITFIAS